MASSWKHETPKEKILYKYRAFSNFENLVDIIVNSRLYAASYDKMNDPMEGGYSFPKTYSDEQIKELETVIGKQKFCSLSASNNIDLMWAHYANGNRGICIGVTLKETRRAGVAYWVNYDGPPNLIHRCDQDTQDRARKILRHKSDCWGYEEEVRIFSNDGHLVDVEIKEIIFGKRADSQLKPLVEALVKAFLPKAVVLTQDDLAQVNNAIRNK
ncbi:DUF2971 domain-containing protein [Shewanella sp.]|uniref:DUF2971 domain-containing protein n=1 Tax=Shewanella sp. TaxID=50422 RepID=UPI0040546756